MNHLDIATKLDLAAMNANAIEQISKSISFSEEDAYEIQRLSIEQRYVRGEQFVGIKLGFTSFAKMEQMGVHDMIWGRLTDGMALDNGGVMRSDKYVHPRAEPEIAFLIQKDIDREISIEEIPEYILACAPAIEIIDSRFEKFKFSLEDVIADNCSSTGFVLGAWQPLPKSLNDLEMTMKFDKNVVQSGNSNAILDNPYLSVCNASRLAAKYKQELKAGNIILAGASTPAEFVEKGKKILVKVEGLGSCEITPK